MAFANWWTLASSVLPYLVAVVYRIHVEETALEAAFGPAYEEYARTTKRLIPWVYQGESIRKELDFQYDPLAQ